MYGTCVRCGSKSSDEVILTSADYVVCLCAACRNGWSEYIRAKNVYLEYLKASTLLNMYIRTGRVDTQEPTSLVERVDVLRGEIFKLAKAWCVPKADEEAT